MSDSRPLRVGVVGLGDIAHKAYLPVLTARSDVALSLMTRNPQTLAATAARLGVTRAHLTLDALLEDDLDAAFVHAATDAHVELVERFVTAGVPVLVDKPLASTLAGARSLVALADERGVSLAIGFNRRYAPAYTALREPEPAVVLMQKNRVGLPDVARRVVFDDLIHVVDTLRFLLPPGPAELDVRCRVGDGLLRSVTVQLSTGGSTAVGVMHRVSGVTEEILEVLGEGHKHRVVDLAEVWRYDARDPGGPRLTRRGDWTPVETQRGFTAMCAEFLDAVRAGRQVSARDALHTHELCEQILAAIDPAGVRTA